MSSPIDKHKAYGAFVQNADCIHVSELVETQAEEIAHLRQELEQAFIVDPIEWSLLHEERDKLRELLRQVITCETEPVSSTDKLKVLIEIQNVLKEGDK